MPLSHRPHTSPSFKMAQGLKLLVALIECATGDGATHVLVQNSESHGAMPLHAARKVIELNTVDRAHVSCWLAPLLLLLGRWQVRLSAPGTWEWTSPANMAVEELHRAPL